MRHNKPGYAFVFFHWVHNELKDRESQGLLAWQEKVNKLIILVAYSPNADQVYFSPG